MLIIGISGGTGSGKTTFVNKILANTSEDDIGVVYQDSYYHVTDHLSMDERKLINFDHPESIDFKLLVKHLKDLKDNKPINQPVYSFIEHNRTKDTVKTSPKKIIIVEGILILSNKELRELCDIKVFVEADADERLIRRLKRDTNERGRNVEEVMNRYKNTLKPMHNRFIEPAKNMADVIIPNHTFNTVGIGILQSIINDKIKE